MSMCFAFTLGMGWERLKNYDQYIYRFSQYSRHIRALAERNEIAQLTNAVILFDKKFYPRYNPEELEDALFRILKEGPYYEDDTTNQPTARH